MPKHTNATIITTPDSQC